MIELLQRLGVVPEIEEKRGDKLQGLVISSGFPQALEIMENLENHQKSSMHGKIVEFNKKN